ncbi:MAG: hypothetical protein HOQ05_14190 [Corynebacteriales bacterium]|nr:hypothetical protein [Mycobacteriales bacterium]
MTFRGWPQIRREVPFFGQLPTPIDPADVFREEFGTGAQAYPQQWAAAQNVPNADQIWQEFGAPDAEVGATYMLNACAVAGIASILTYRDGGLPSVFGLTEQALEAGAFGYYPNVGSDVAVKPPTLSGLRYAPAAIWLRDTHGIAATGYLNQPNVFTPKADEVERAAQQASWARNGIDEETLGFYRPEQDVEQVKKDFAAGLTLEKLRAHVSQQDSFALVSVSPAIRWNKAASGQAAGHLVLVTDADEHAFTYHDPAGLRGSSKNQRMANWQMTQAMGARPRGMTLSI